MSRNAECRVELTHGRGCRRRGERGGRLRAALLGMLLAFAAPGAALAHDGGHGDPWRTWQLAPLLLGGLGLLAGLYARGVGRVWGRAGAGRGVTRAQAAAFAGGWLALAAALVSPLDAAAGHWFSAHMAQHIVLMLVAAPLLALSRPLAALAWGLRDAPGAMSLAAFLRDLGRCPLPVAWALYSGATWLWHVPALYQAALRSELLHSVEHASFVGTALLFWWAVLHPRGGLGLGASVLAVFTIAVQGGLLSALIVFAPTPWYPAYGAGVSAAAALADQRLAGAIMWAPSGLIYAGALAALVLRWLRSVERATAAPALGSAKEEPL